MANSVPIFLFLILLGSIDRTIGICRKDPHQSWMECEEWQNVLDLKEPQEWQRLSMKRNPERPVPIVCENSPFKNFPNLTVLNLQQFSLSSIGVDCFDGPMRRSIDEIDLTNNTITSFDATSLNNSEVATLILDRNKITELNLEGILLPKLRRLRVQSNELRSLKLGDYEFPELMNVLAWGNRIEDLDIKLKNVYALMLSQNQIRSLENIQAPELHFLVVEDNRLESLNLTSFSELLKLQEVYAHGNDIKSVDGSHCNLVSVKLTENKLAVELNEKEQAYFIKLDWSKVLQLNLSYNAIEEYSYSPEEEFAIFGVQEMNLNNNKITEIRDNTFSAMRELVYLDLSHNKIAAISESSFKGLTKLNTLKVNNNCLRQLDAETFISFNAIVKLDLSTNLLSSFPIPASVQYQVSEGKILS